MLGPRRFLFRKLLLAALLVLPLVMLLIDRASDHRVFFLVGHFPFGSRLVGNPVSSPSHARVAYLVTSGLSESSYSIFVREHGQMFPAAILGLMPTEDMARQIKRFGTGKTIHLKWSPDGNAVALIWGGIYVAAYDFTSRRQFTSGEKDVIRIYDVDGNLTHEFEKEMDRESTNDFLRTDRSIRKIMR